jgi:hypothetical protein
LEVLLLVEGGDALGEGRELGFFDFGHCVAVGLHRSGALCNVKREIQ